MEQIEKGGRRLTREERDQAAAKEVVRLSLALDARAGAGAAAKALAERLAKMEQFYAGWAADGSAVSARELGVLRQKGLANSIKVNALTEALGRLDVPEVLARTNPAQTPAPAAESVPVKITEKPVYWEKDTRTTTPKAAAEPMQSEQYWARLTDATLGKGTARQLCAKPFHLIETLSYDDRLDRQKAAEWDQKFEAEIKRREQAQASPEAVRERIDTMRRELFRCGVTLPEGHYKGLTVGERDLKGALSAGQLSVAQKNADEFLAAVGANPTALRANTTAAREAREFLRAQGGIEFTL